MTDKGFDFTSCVRYFDHTMFAGFFRKGDAVTIYFLDMTGTTKRV
jgi:hypothetical protein